MSTLGEYQYHFFAFEKLCARFRSNGLVEKVHLTLDITIEQVKKRFMSVQWEVMFPFHLLTCKLLVVAVDHYQFSFYIFQWTTYQLAKLGNQWNTVYIFGKRFDAA